MNTILGVLSLLCLATPAVAWTYSADEDPLHDTPIALVTEEASSGGLGQSVGIGLKCWKGGEIQMRVMIIGPAPADVSERLVTAEVRIDKGQAFSLPMMTQKVGNTFSLVTAVSDAKHTEIPVLRVLSELKAARTRLVVGVNNVLLTFPAANVKRAVEQFATRCEIPLGAQPTD